MRTTPTTSALPRREHLTVQDAIRDRRSTRAFRKYPVPHKILEDILEIASRAPSGSNIQPLRTGDLSPTGFRCLSRGCSRNTRHPDNQIVMCGMAWGFPETEASVDGLRTQREAVATVATFLEEPGNDGPDPSLPNTGWAIMLNDRLTRKESPRVLLRLWKGY